MRVTKKMIEARVAKCSRYDATPSVEVNSDQARGERRFYWLQCRKHGTLSARDCTCAHDGCWSYGAAQRRASIIEDAWREKLKPVSKISS